jgi:hypothetical protein
LAASPRRSGPVHGFSAPFYLWDATFPILQAAGFRVNALPSVRAPYSPSSPESGS